MWFDENSNQDDDDNDEKVLDEEFKALFDEFADSSMTQEEYIDFDIEVCTSYPEINSDEVNWKVSSVSKYVSEWFVIKKLHCFVMNYWLIL